MPLNKIIVSLIVVFLFISGDMKSQLSGVKTIGDDIDDHYPTIKAAVDSLVSKGINSSVVFKIDSGTYYGGFRIDAIPGASENHTILFTSETGNSNDVVIEKEFTNSNNYLVKLYGCEYVTFKKITFKTESDSLAKHILLTEGASYNRFENCVFNAKVEEDCDSENYTDGIVIHDQPSEDKNEFNKFINNKIIGGCIGISLEGKTGDLEKGNEITVNEFTKQKYKAVEVVHNDSGYFNHNTVIYEGDSTAVSLKVDNIYEVKGNSIYSGGETALFIDTFNAQTPKPLFFKGLSVFNNTISCPGGIALKGNKIDGFFFGHNTLFNDTEQYTIDIDSVINMLSVFNLLVNKANHGVFHITTSAIPNDTLEKREFGSNFNGVYSGDSTIGKFNNTIYTKIEDWRTNEHGPDIYSSFGKMEFDNDTTGLELICGTSPSMRIKKEKLDSDGQEMINLLSNQLVNLFQAKDIDGNERDTSKFWKGQAEINMNVNVSGHITDSFGIDTLKAGKVLVFAKMTNKNILEEIGEMDVSESGYYTIDSLPYRDYYWLKIIPTDDDSVYVPSYHNGELRWDHFNDSSAINDFLPLDDFCLDTLKDFFPRKLDTLSAGDYTLSGNVSKTGGPNPNKMDGNDPIPGLDVILDQIPPSRTVAITQTDEYGNYSFSNLPEGTFIVTIDYQGLPTDTLYKVILDGGIDSIVNLDYCVDLSEQIEGCPDLIVGKENIQFKDIQLYPNPMRETLTISGIGGKFDLSILDARGREIINLSNQNEYALISTVDFKSGIYFVLIKTSDGNSMYKIIK